MEGFRSKRAALSYRAGLYLLLAPRDGRRGDRHRHPPRRHVL